MARFLAVTNRTVLLTVGGLSLLGGTWATVARTSLAEHLPSWRFLAPGDESVVLHRQGLADLRAHGWWVPAIISVGTLGTVMLTWWLVGQLRWRTRSRLRLTMHDGVLRTRALEEALKQRMTAIDGVARARVRIHGSRRRLRARARVWLEPGIAPTTVLAALADVGTEAEEIAAPYHLSTRVRLSRRTHRKPHVR